MGSIAPPAVHASFESVVGYVAIAKELMPKLSFREYRNFS